MLYKMGLHGVDQIWVDMLYALFAGLLVAGLFLLLEPTLEIIVGAYLETKERYDVDVTNEVFFQPPDGEAIVRDTQPKNLKKGILRIAGGRSIPFSEEEVTTVYRISARVQADKLPIPPNGYSDTALQKMENAGLLEIDEEGLISLTDAGKKVLAPVDVIET